MSVLNYQGNKNKLLEFLDKNLKRYLPKGKAFLDIFSGGSSVCGHFSRFVTTYANDIEPYSYQIARGFLTQNQFGEFDDRFFADFNARYQTNVKCLSELMADLLAEEKKYLLESGSSLERFYSRIPTLWNGLFSPILNEGITIESIQNRRVYFSLFTLLYSSSYFGLKQAIEIDSIRAAIEGVSEAYNVGYLYSSLFHSMNCAVLSKDGHMAQPLSLVKYETRARKKRTVSIIEVFTNEVKKYRALPKPISNKNKVFNKDFIDLIASEDLSDVGLIYADPPYTDMQYSRYYHLLNTVCEYRFAEPTLSASGYSKGLYLNNRRQSKISVRKTFIPALTSLMNFCKSNGVNLAISFGYPEEKSGEKNDRYLASIDDLSWAAKTVFGDENVEIVGEFYTHSNQRKSVRKKVTEYLILCKGASYDR